MRYTPTELADALHNALSPDRLLDADMAEYFDTMPAGSHRESDDSFQWVSDADGSPVAAAPEYTAGIEQGLSLVPEELRDRVLRRALNEGARLKSNFGRMGLMVGWAVVQANIAGLVGSGTRAFTVQQHIPLVRVRTGTVMARSESEAVTLAKGAGAAWVESTSTVQAPDEVQPWWTATEK